MAEIYTRKGVAILVDDEDFASLSKHVWRLDGLGYAGRNIRTPKGTLVCHRIHRQIMGLEIGDKRRVDHINGNKLDNRRANLRIASQAQNLHNRGAQRNNTSGYKGVTYNKRDGCWVAEITANGQRERFYGFKSAEDAHRAYCDAASRMHGEFANMGA